ncbi:YraN family protein [Chloroflexota bacterium]
MLETNYSCSQGEIDTVARYKGSLVFIEVGVKRSLVFGSPEESIISAK